ncbi:TPA: glutamine amidotransferase [Patescibacteria group bacterium]|nr:glutamine amidotransferase [Patescibacteria group bacterium]HCU47576.1 glutamine amidotransferase [Patescibacteria group bacterium]
MPAKFLIIKNITREGPGLLSKLLSDLNCQFDIVDMGAGKTASNLSEYDALIVLGGPDSANDASDKMIAELKIVKDWLLSDKPYLGICLGMQVLVKAAGGQVIKNQVKEIGFHNAAGKPYEIELTSDGVGDPMFAGLPSKFPIFHLHGETVTLPAEGKLLARGRWCINQVVKVAPLAYGIQGHLELERDLLEHWLVADPDLATLNSDELIKDFMAWEQATQPARLTFFKNFINLIQAE